LKACGFQLCGLAEPQHTDSSIAEEDSQRLKNCLDLQLRINPKKLVILVRQVSAKQPRGRQARWQEGVQILDF